MKRADEIQEIKEILRYLEKRETDLEEQTRASINGSGTGLTAEQNAAEREVQKSSQPRRNPSIEDALPRSISGRHSELPLLTGARLDVDFLVERDARAQHPTLYHCPIDEYTSEHRFRQELSLFRRYPMVAGHASSLAKPGDFFTDDIAGAPLLFTYPTQGAPRAFFNACRHRGTKLVCESSGEGCKTIVCPYHSWTYHSDGRLLGIAHEKTFGKVERSEMGLVPVSLRSQFGLLWVCLEGEQPPEIPERLAAELQWLGLETSVAFQPYKRRWNFNWKLGVDGGLESYHFRYAHAKTIASFFFDNLLRYIDFAPNARLTFPKRTMQSLPGTPEENWKLREHANLLYFLFPNTFLLAQGDYTALLRMNPVSVKECDIEITMLIPERPQSEKAQRHWEKNRAIMIDALEEDFVLGEKIQSTLHSGANRFFTFGKNEFGLTHFHNELSQRLQATRESNQ
jgi:phenylpropionate dioxygenase-like ring-hydroxylating dioxygenase large terminal subunit